MKPVTIGPDSGIEVFWQGCWDIWYKLFQVFHCIYKKKLLMCRGISSTVWTVENYVGLLRKEIKIGASLSKWN